MKAILKVGSIDGQTNDRQEIQVDGSGEFELETNAVELGIFATTADGSATATTVSKSHDGSIELVLLPSCDIHGRVLKDEEPLTGHKVSAIATVRQPASQPQTFAFPDSFEVARIETTTDREGRYKLANVPRGLEVRIFADPVETSGSIVDIETICLEEKESREPFVTKVLSSRVSGILEKHQTRLRDCKLSHFHMMLVASRPEADTFVSENFVNHNLSPHVVSFLQLPVVATDQQTDDSGESQLLKKYGLSMPNANEVLAVALDCNGIELGRSTIDVNDEDAKAKATDFHKKHAPKVLEAKKEWATAFAEAKESGRRVWVRTGTRYCGPCFRLSRWFDEQRSLLDKDFVMLHINPSMDEDGIEVTERLLRGSFQGSPFHGIFDEDEKLIIDSEGPTGNIGAIGGSEGKKHLRKMLKESRVRLTDQEIESIVESVE